MLKKNLPESRVKRPTHWREEKNKKIRESVQVIGTQQVNHRSENREQWGRNNLKVTEEYFLQLRAHHVPRLRYDNAPPQGTPVQNFEMPGAKSRPKALLDASSAEIKNQESG